MIKAMKVLARARNRYTHIMRVSTSEKSIARVSRRLVRAELKALNAIESHAEFSIC